MLLEFKYGGENDDYNESIIGYTSLSLIFHVLEFLCDSLYSSSLFATAHPVNHLRLL